MSVTAKIWKAACGKAHVVTAAFGRPSEGEAPRHYDI
jgi:hypothetical protein